MRTHILALGFLAALAAGCRDSTAPQRPVSSTFLLDSVAGRPLPSIEFAGAGDTVMASWGVLTLDGEGHAVSVEGRRHVYLAYPPEDQTLTISISYRITRDSITLGYFGPPVPCGACSSFRETGALTGAALTLTPDYGGGLGPTYHYHLISTR